MRRCPPLAGDIRHTPTFPFARRLRSSRGQRAGGSRRTGNQAVNEQLMWLGWPNLRVRHACRARTSAGHVLLMKARTAAISAADSVAASRLRYHAAGRWAGADAGRCFQRRSGADGAASRRNGKSACLRADARLPAPRDTKHRPCVAIDREKRPQDPLDPSSGRAPADPPSE